MVYRLLLPMFVCMAFLLSGAVNAASFKSDSLTSSTTNGSACTATGSFWDVAKNALVSKCGLARYDRNLGHDCDRIGKQWLCSTTRIENGVVTAPTPVCTVTGSSWQATKEALVRKCGLVRYGRDLGHDCDQVNGQWLCSTTRIENGVVMGQGNTGKPARTTATSEKAVPKTTPSSSQTPTTVSRSAAPKAPTTAGKTAVPEAPSTVPAAPIPSVTRGTSILPGLDRPVPFGAANARSQTQQKTKSASPYGSRGSKGPLLGGTNPIACTGSNLIKRTKFPASATIQNNRSAIANFWNQYGLGTSRPSDIKFPSTPLTVENNILKVPFSVGDAGGNHTTPGKGTYIFNAKPEFTGRSVYYSYWIKFDKNFSWDCDESIHGKLQKDGEQCAFRGGKVGISHSVGRVPPGGRPGIGNFQLTTMWRHNGRLHAYIYHPDMLNDKYPDYSEPDALFTQIRKDRWYYVEMEARINDSGKSNGRVRYWINGSLEYDRSNFRFTNAQTVKFSTAFKNFFGGPDDFSWSSQTNGGIEFSDIQICKLRPTSQGVTR